MHISELLPEKNTLTFTIPPYGTFTLLVLVWDDYEWLANTDIRALPARTFVQQFFERHLLEPKHTLEEIATFPDEQLQAIVAAWWNAQEECQKLVELPHDAALDAIQHAFIQYYNTHTLPMMVDTQKFLEPYQKLVTSIELTAYQNIATTLQKFLSNPLSTLTANVSTFSQQMRLPALVSPPHDLPQLTQQWIEQSNSLSHMVSEVLRPQLNMLVPFSAEILQTFKFFQALPDFSEFQKFFEEWKDAEKNFHQTDFWFIKKFLPAKILLEFDTYPEEGRRERISQELVELTQDEQFERLLTDIVEKSDVLRPRLLFLREAFPAYRSGLYRIATPAFLLQVEGVIGDALLLKDVLLIQGNKIYRRGSDGNPALDSKNRPIEVRGMGSLINESKWKNHPLLDDMAIFITTRLSGDRNGILHGRDLSYGENATIAARCIWILRYFIEQISAFESGNIKSL